MGRRLNKEAVIDLPFVKDINNRGRQGVPMETCILSEQFRRNKVTVGGLVRRKFICSTELFRRMLRGFFEKKISWEKILKNPGILSEFRR